MVTPAKSAKNLDARRDRSGAVTHQRRETIRAAATTEFAINGYQGATLRQVAAKAGLAQGHLSYYYSTKIELLGVIMVEFQEIFSASMRSAVAESGHPLTTLTSLLEQHVVTLCSNVNAARVSYENLRFLAPKDRARLIRKRDTYEAGLAKLIDQARASTTITDIPTNLLCKVVLGIVNWPYQWYRSNGAISIEALASMLAQRAVASVLDAIDADCLRPPRPGQRGTAVANTELPPKPSAIEAERTRSRVVANPAP